MAGCIADGCECEKVVGRGLCRTHYGRWHRTGSIEDRPRKKTPIEERFWPKVDKRGEDECWGWLSTKTGRGYGSIGRGSKASGKEMAHRVSYQIHYGEIPAGKWILHSCDNPACVNPKHLRAGTAIENSRDAIDRQRHVKPPVFTGESNHKAKLKLSEVEFIRSKPNVKAEYFAKMFSVSMSTIYTVRRGATWSEKP